MKKDDAKFKSKLKGLKHFNLKKFFKSDSKNDSFFKDKLSSISNKIDNFIELNQNKSNNKKAEFENIRKDIKNREFKKNRENRENKKFKDFNNKTFKNRNITETYTDKRDIESISNIKSIRESVNNNAGMKNNIENPINNQIIKNISKKINKNNSEDNSENNSKYNRRNNNQNNNKNNNYNDNNSNNNITNKNNSINKNNIKHVKNRIDENNRDNEDVLNELNEIFNFNQFNPIKKIKNSFNEDDSKTIIGGAIFGLIVIVLLFSTYYFIFYQPYQEDLANTKTNKLNELNSLFKGPLALESEVLSLSSEIKLATSPEEVNAIDVLRPATASWRIYQTKQINNTRDDFNRVMIIYDAIESEGSLNNNNNNNGINNGETNKNVIMDDAQAQEFVNNNDGKVLANVIIKKPDTVAVPILITKLQAGAGLITIGSVVDIYTLSDGSSQVQSDSDSSNYEGNQENNGGNNSINNENNSDNNVVGNAEGNSENIENNDNGNSNDNMNSGSGELNTGMRYGSTIGNSPDISGSTVLAIMRSKDSGVISADYIKSKNSINSNISNQIEDSNSFNTDIEELIRGSISGGYDEQYISSLLNRYGLKLGDYERKANLGEIDVQYLLLVEVPREDVSHVINNMDNIILTIPTEKAPSWMIEELKQTYSDN